MGHVSSRIRRDQVPGTRSRKGRGRPPLFLVPRSAGGSARGSPCPRASRSIPPYRPARVSVTEGRLGERRTVRVGIGRPMAGSPKLFAISGLQPSRRSDHRVRFRTVAGRGKRGGDSSFMLTQPYPLHVERVAPEWNQAHVHMLAIEPTLMGTPHLLRRWADRHARPDDDGA